jgi:hypothetical protein
MVNLKGAHSHVTSQAKNSVDGRNRKAFWKLFSSKMWLRGVGDVRNFTSSLPNSFCFLRALCHHPSPIIVEKSSDGIIMESEKLVAEFIEHKGPQEVHGSVAWKNALGRVQREHDPPSEK